jgi:hypothetical protein
MGEQTHVRPSLEISLNIHFIPRRAAWRGGVTVAVTSPQGDNLVGGLGVAFYTHGHSIDDALVSSPTSLHLHIGNNAKSGGSTGTHLSPLHSHLHYWSICHSIIVLHHNI